MSAAVQVVEVTPAQRAEWDRFVRAREHAEVAHRWEFQAALEEVFSLPVYRLAALRADGWAGVLPLVHQHSLVGSFLTSLPYLNHAGVLSADPQARSALGAAAVALAERLGADRLELRGRDGADLPIEVWDGKVQHLLDLPEDPAVLWDRLGAKVRAQVKRPGKDGYSARVIAAPDLPRGRAIFYPLLARRWHSLGSPILPERFFKTLEQACADSIQYVVVEKDGPTVAAGLLLRCGDEVEIPWAASAPAHDRAGVNMLLYWTALTQSIANGARRFDFGRSTPGSGNARFKAQWGAAERPLRWNVRVRDARGRAAERGTGGRGLAAAAWRMLPGFLAARIGPVLAARIPY